MMPKNIIFYFPYSKGAGGVNVLFLRIANYLADTTELSVYIGDYQNGYMVSHNKNSKLKELRLVIGRPLRVPPDSVVVFQTLPPWYISDELLLEDDTKILFWTLHPYNLLMYFRLDTLGKPGYYRIAAPYVQRLMKEFTALLVDRSGIVFMDGENRRSAEVLLGSSIKTPCYVPIASGRPNRLQLKYADSFAWLGRLADFKVPILIYTMKTLSEYANKNLCELSFHVIGDGPAREQIKGWAGSLLGKYLKIDLIGEVEERQIEQMLNSKARVLFAMGTSALEGARLGIPTVLLDFSYRAIEGEYLYSYVYETEDFTLGREINGPGYKKKGRALEEIINELRDPVNYETIGDRCYQYYIQNHDIATVSSKLLEAIEHCDLRFKMIRYLRNNFLMRIFKGIKKSRQL